MYSVSHVQSQSTWMDVKRMNASVFCTQKAITLPQARGEHLQIVEEGVGMDTQRQDAARQNLAQLNQRKNADAKDGILQRL
jgi:hypothetical protein